MYSRFYHGPFSSPPIAVGSKGTFGRVCVPSLACKSRIDSGYGGWGGKRKRQGPGPFSREIPYSSGRTAVGRTVHGLLRDRLRPRTRQARRTRLADGKRHRPPQLRRSDPTRTDDRSLPRRLRQKRDLIAFQHFSTSAFQELGLSCLVGSYETAPGRRAHTITLSLPTRRSRGSGNSLLVEATRSLAHDKQSAGH